MIKSLKIILALLGILTLFVIACGDGSTNGPDMKEPQLSVSSHQVNLSGNPYVDLIMLTNAGSGQLQWKVTEKPEWMELSTTSGVISGDTVFVRIFTNIENLEYGIYHGTIKIESNGGNTTLNVEFEHKPPKLKIENLLFNMDRHFNRTDLVIINEGGGELIWRIAAAPEWVEFQVTEDTVRAFTQYVPFEVKFRSLDYGFYESIIKIESNGGNSEIAIYFTYEREIEVFPGIGAAYIELGQTYTMVQNQWGKPDRNWYDRPEETLFIHHFTYDDIGLHFAVKTNSLILFGSGKVGYIELYPPYDGMTEKLIGIGNTIDELKAAYGDPTNISGKKWYYDIGITFVIKSGKINGMIIKEEDF